MTVPGVIEVEKCRARKMGLDFYVDLHVGVDGKISVHEGHEIAHRVKAAIQQNDSRIADVLVHIEPAENMSNAGCGRMTGSEARNVDRSQSHGYSDQRIR